MIQNERRPTTCEAVLCVVVVIVVARTLFFFFFPSSPHPTPPATHSPRCSSFSFFVCLELAWVYLVYAWLPAEVVEDASWSPATSSLRPLVTRSEATAASTALASRARGGAAPATCPFVATTSAGSFAFEAWRATASA